MLLHRIMLTGVLLAATSYAAELQMESIAAGTSEAAVINVRLRSSPDALTGVQFDLEYDTAGLDVKVEVGPAAESAGKVAQTAVLGQARQRVIIFGFNRNNLADGVVAVLHIKVRVRAAPGSKYNIKLAAPAGTNEKGEAVTVTAPQGALTVPVIPADQR